MRIIICIYINIQYMNKLKKLILSHERVGDRKNVVVRRIFNKILEAGRKVPTQYINGLDDNDMHTQLEHLKKLKVAYKNKKYLNRPKLKSYKSKGSKHILKAKKIYNVNAVTPQTMAGPTKCSKTSLEKIISKGRGAYYSSGSRPNTSSEAWARARLASATTGGKAACVDMKQLVEGCNENSPVFKHAKCGGKTTIKGGSVRFEKAGHGSHKKYVAVFDPVEKFGWAQKRVSFGARGYSDYTKHKNKKRRSNYRKRHAKDLLVRGAKKDVRRPGYLSMYVLWGDSDNIKVNMKDFSRRYKNFVENGNFDTRFYSV